MRSRLLLVPVVLWLALGVSGCLGNLAARADLTFGMHVQGNTPLERALVLQHADATTNHGLSWNVIEPSPGTWDFTYADATYEWAVANDLRQTGFSFAWDQQLLDDLPAWVLEIRQPDELRAVLQERARTIFDRYPELHRINVVNEPLELLGGELYANHFLGVLGRDYVEELLRIVDAAAPESVELIINENLVEYSQAKADGLVALATDLVAAGAPIDGVGLQSHFLLGAPDWDRYREVMSDLGDLGLDVHVTELDVPVAPDLPDRLAVQADRYRRAVQTCLSVAACRSINVWGVDDGHTWLDGFLGPGHDPLLFDADGNGKPAFAAVVSALLDGRPR